MILKRRAGKLEEVHVTEILDDVLNAVIANYVHYSDTKYNSIQGFGYYFPEVVKDIDNIVYKQNKMKEMLQILKGKREVSVHCEQLTL